MEKKITPQNRVYETRFFLTNTGNQFCEISKRMKEVVESFGVSVLTSGLQKRSVLLRRTSQKTM